MQNQQSHYCVGMKVIIIRLCIQGEVCDKLAVIYKDIQKPECSLQSICTLTINHSLSHIRLVLDYEIHLEPAAVISFLVHTTNSTQNVLRR